MQAFARRHAAFVKNVERLMEEIPDPEASKEVSPSLLACVAVSGNWAEEDLPDIGLV